MGRVTSPSRVAALTLWLVVAMTAGCTNEGWACGQRSAGGCFCTFDEVLSEPAAECSTSVTGGTRCCDDEATDTCVCRPPPSCWEDGEVCGCSLARPSGAVPTLSACVADPGFVCCINDVVHSCICGFVECLLPDDRLAISCDESTVDLCTAGERAVSDCVTRE